MGGRGRSLAGLGQRRPRNPEESYLSTPPIKPAPPTLLHPPAPASSLPFLPGARPDQSDRSLGAWGCWGH